jgi:hypothetical protein
MQRPVVVDILQTDLQGDMIVAASNGSDGLAMPKNNTSELRDPREQIVHL